jgi:hypothetical protein
MGVGNELATAHAFAALRYALARIGAVPVPLNFMLSPDARSRRALGPGELVRWI